MNVLIIPSWYPSKGLPISGIFFREQAVALSKGGHNVTVIDVSFHGREDIFNSKNFRFTCENDKGVQIYAFKIPSFYILSRVKFIHTIIFKLFLSFVYKKIIRKGLKFDVIHAHSFYLAGYCACKLSEKYKIPLVVTEHSSDVLRVALGKRGRQLLEHTANRCNTFICVSEVLKQNVYIQVKTNKELVVVPNMFSLIFSYSDGKRKDSEFIFFSAGNLVAGKRHAFTISCFNKAFKDCPHVKLRIAGSGVLYGALQRQILENCLSEKVQLLGFLNKEQMKMELDHCNTFVLASAFETFGIVYIEAMACGNPVISTKNGGADDIVNETNGILIDVDNEEQLIAAFQYMYQNVDKFDNKQIAADCYTKYSEEAVVKQLSVIYETVMRLYKKNDK